MPEEVNERRLAGQVPPTARAERERIAADRAEAERLLAEAALARREATAARNRARVLASRFVRRIKHRHAQQRRALEAERVGLAQQVAEFNAVRSEFHATAAAARDRLRDAWAVVETQQRRTAGEWAEANRYLAEQVATLDARAAELDAREKTTGDKLAHAEADVAGLREEAAAIEQRVQHARAALAELERRRDRDRAELLHTELPGEIAPPTDPDDLAHRELLLNREKGAVAALRSSLELESADLDDRRRLVAEQLAQLAEARARWQLAERQTVVEMEELARSLEHRERSLDARESRLIRADVRRREDAHDLWRLRLRLEAWQTKLTAFEVRWHTEREELEANLEQRRAAVARREAELAVPSAPILPARRDVASAPSEELAALRAEVERLAAAILEIEPPDAEPAEPELPWAAAGGGAVSHGVLPFGDNARAA